MARNERAMLATRIRGIELHVARELAKFREKLDFSERFHWIMQDRANLLDSRSVVIALKISVARDLLRQTVRNIQIMLGYARKAEDLGNKLQILASQKRAYSMAQCLQQALLESVAELMSDERYQDILYGE